MHIDEAHVLPIYSTYKPEVSISTTAHLETTGVIFNDNPQDTLQRAERRRDLFNLHDQDRYNEAVLKIRILATRFLRNKKGKVREVATKFWVESVNYHECESNNYTKCHNLPIYLTGIYANSLTPVCQEHTPAKTHALHFDEVELLLRPTAVDKGKTYVLTTVTTVPESNLPRTETRVEQLQNIEQIQQLTGVTLNLGDPRTFSHQSPSSKQTLRKLAPYTLTGGSLATIGTVALATAIPALLPLAIAIGAAGATSIGAGVKGLLSKETLNRYNKHIAKYYPANYHLHLSTIETLNPFTNTEEEPSTDNTPHVDLNYLVNVLPSFKDYDISGAKDQVLRLKAAGHDILIKEPELDSNIPLKAHFEHIYGDVIPKLVNSYLVLPPSYHKFPEKHPIVRDVVEQLKTLNDTVREIREELYSDEVMNLKMVTKTVEAKYGPTPDLLAKAYGEERNRPRI